MNTDQYLSYNISLVFISIFILQTHLRIVFPASEIIKHLRESLYLWLVKLFLIYDSMLYFLNLSENQIPQNTRI